MTGKTDYGRDESVRDLSTPSLRLVPQSRDEVLAMVEAMPPDVRAQVSPDWLARLRASTTKDPWVHGFSMVRRDDEKLVGSCSFKGPPADGIVEIAYVVEAEEQGKGYATEAAQALVAYALTSREVCVVRAHTLPEMNASTRVLEKCGFRRIGEVVDPEDGPVWRFEQSRGA
jgi:[ribosomal protein S5]-alanine N-acetyltransferase